MTGELKNKVAVVTGGSAGIGLGIAKSFAEEGARVFITGRREAELDKAANAIGGNATAIQGDTSKFGDLDRIYARIEDKARYIDGLAVNGGVYEFGTLGEITEEHFDKTFNSLVAAARARAGPMGGEAATPDQSLPREAGPPAVRRSRLVLPAAVEVTALLFGGGDPPRSRRRGNVSAS